MILPDEKLKSLLINSGIINEQEWQSAEAEAKRKKKSTGEILVSRGRIADHELGAIVADAIGYPFVRLSETAISEDVLRIIPEPMSRSQRIIAFARDASGIKVAMAQPANLETLRFLEKKTGERVRPYYATPQDIENAFSRYHQYGASFTDEMRRLVSLAMAGETKPGEEAVIRLVDHIIKYGFESRASDIHIEPHTHQTLVRLRIDGILHDVGILPTSVHEMVVARIKVLARMRLDEHHSAQDGRFQKKILHTPVDIRVSIVPITKGEKVVMRLLAEQVQRFTLENIGLAHHDYERVRRNLSQPWGMILATGPTGSGKTTTLYAMLKVLNTRGVNISTIEDPVEYDIEGVNQIQVNPKTNLTFAAGLRAIVRQNPDIIMVGEIRDSETAGIAVNAAMTGHLIFSTLHTNDAATTLPRLIDMQVEPFLIASSVNIIIAQRLVRNICMRCIETYTIPQSRFKREHPRLYLVVQRMYKGKGEALRLYHGSGCNACGKTGYAGRTGIFEVMEIGDKLRELVRKRADADRLREQARKEGMKTLLEDGVAKMIAGVTTLEEVLRVTREEEA